MCFAGLYGEPPNVSKPANPTAARPDPAYVGTYTNPYVGDIDVVARTGKLEIVEGPNDIRFTLKHLDGDTFSYKPTRRSRLMFVMPHCEEHSFESDVTDLAKYWKSGGRGDIAWYTTPNTQ